MKLAIHDKLEIALTFSAISALFISPHRVLSMSHAHIDAKVGLLFTE